jgi:hypothetical protein
LMVSRSGRIMGVLVSPAQVGSPEPQSDGVYLRVATGDWQGVYPESLPKWQNSSEK